MDRFWLNFSNPATEREYNAYIVRRALGPSDVKFLKVMVGLCVAVLLKHTIKYESATPVVLDLLCMVFFCREIGFRNGGGDWPDRRTFRVLVSRVLLQSLHCVYSQLRTGFPSTTFPVACIKGGVIFTSLFTMNLRLPFRYHLPFQILCTCVMVCFAIDVPCHVLMTMEGASNVASIAKLLNTAAEGIIVVMYGCYGFQADRWDDWPMMCPCLHVLAWLYIFVILVLGSYVVWRMERSSRMAFVRSLPAQRRKTEGLESVCSQYQTDWIHVFIWLIMLSVTWKLTYPVVYFVQSFQK